MIPQRMLSSEIYGSGLKDRVIACRKRLRVNRVTQRTLVNDDVEELFPETVPSVSQFNSSNAGNLPECPAAHFSTSAVRPVTEAEDSESMLLAEEQEVGIT